MSEQPVTMPERVIAAFGGLSATARALGHRNVTTVDGWKRSGRIPHWRKLEIAAAAKRENIELPHDFHSSVDDQPGAAT